MTNVKLVFKYAFKDLARQKVRSLIGIFGIFVSVALLAIVLFLSDSISVTFIDYLSIDAGGTDMLINIRHYNGEPSNRSNYFDYNPIVEKIEFNYPNLADYIPRMEFWGNTNISKGFNTPELTNQITPVLISAINFSLEKEIGFGSFVKPGSNQLLGLDSLGDNGCAIYYQFNDIIQYAVNDTIELRMAIRHGDTTFYRTHSFTVEQLFDFQLKWPIRYINRPLIILDIQSVYSIFSNDMFNGKCNDLIVALKESKSFYDARDLGGSENRVKDLAGEIQLLVGINEYNLELPKLEALGYSEFLSVGITIIFVFVSMISMLISGVLINGILKTSVEERIREFGIFRTLGANKKYNLFIVLLQGFLICNFGTIFGIIGAYLLTEFLILPIAATVVASSIPGLAGSVTFSITIWSITIAYLIGIGVGLVVSISPSIKVMKLQLIESIHPYRHEDTLYHLQKRASVNYKLIIVGAILAGNGAFVLFIIPRIIISGDLALISGTLIALLIVFLIGTTLAGLGLMPVILRFFIQLFRLIFRKLSPIYKIFIFRYARRNSSTIIIFAFTFSFVIFTSTAFQFLSSQVTISSNLQYGSDMVIETEGWQEPEESSSNGGFFGGGGFSSQVITLLQASGSSVNPNRILTIDFESELLKIDGIEKVSSVIASPSHLTEIYLEEGKEFTAELGDFAGLFTTQISLIGIDQEYPSTINTEYIEFTEGNIETSFDQLFYNSQERTCVISDSLATSLNLNLNDLARIAIQRGDESEIFTFKIVGIAANLPGFINEFGRSGVSMAGVMISQENYMYIMDMPPIPYLDKIFLKLRNPNINFAQSIEDQIEDGYENDFDFSIINLQREINQGQSYFSILDTFFMITLDATIVICLFGLLSSSYSTIIERKKEIGIIRTLGLKGKELYRLFTIESMIIMLSSGTVGVIIGWTTGLLLSTSINLLSDLPNVPGFPLTNMISIFIVAIIFTLIGMKLLSRSLRKKKIVEIHRETI